MIKNSGCEFVIYDMGHGGLTLDKFKELSLISKNRFGSILEFLKLVIIILQDL